MRCPPARPRRWCWAMARVFWGRGFGATHRRGRVGEVCFNTGLTGYQETLTDPSYAGQIITFTFPPYRQCRRQPRGCGGDDDRRRSGWS